MTFTLKEFNETKLLPFAIHEEEPGIRIDFIEYNCRIFFKTCIGFQCYFTN